MKLVTFERPSEKPHIGVLAPGGEHVVDLLDAAQALRGTAPAHFLDMLSLLDGGEAALDDVRATAETALTQRPPNTVHRLADLRLLAPVPRPRSIRDCMAFEKHIVQATRSVVRSYFPPLAWLDALVEKVAGRALIGAPRVWYKHPVYYKSNPFSVVGTEAEVRWPSYTNKLDYELEFGVFIGKAGRDIPAAKAREHIAGYTIFNDFSARDVQLKEMGGRLGPAKGKDFDTGNAMGPYLVTADEVPDPYTLSMVARVNGEEWSRGSSRDMHWRFEDIIAWMSADETLHPGEFIGSGTVGGGCGLENGRWLSPGDVVELEVGGLGVLRNRVVRA